MITKEEAIVASEFHDTRCRRWRRNGVTKVWKTRPTEFRVPVKYGMYVFGYITDRNVSDYHVASACPKVTA